MQLPPPGRLSLQLTGPLAPGLLCLKPAHTPVREQAEAWLHSHFEYKYHVWTCTGYEWHPAHQFERQVAQNVEVAHPTPAIVVRSVDAFVAVPALVAHGLVTAC